MNRRVKFRAYNLTQKKWLDESWSHIFVGDGDTIVVGKCPPDRRGGYTWEQPPRFVFGYDKIEIMQFTGLHDKNEKEIWEGDVVEINDGNDTYTREVKWEKGGYTFDIWEDFAPLISDEALTLEVIGNKFEHPDLFEKSE
jgi:uncharacterized phage protein (TIGR01671 family)